MDWKGKAKSWKAYFKSCPALAGDDEQGGSFSYTPKHKAIAFTLDAFQASSQTNSIRISGMRFKHGYFSKHPDDFHGQVGTIGIGH